MNDNESVMLFEVLNEGIVQWPWPFSISLGSDEMLKQFGISRTPHANIWSIGDGVVMDGLPPKMLGTFHGGTHFRGEVQHRSFG
jgi:hypothetical protein